MYRFNLHCSAMVGTFFFLRDMEFWGGSAALGGGGASVNLSRFDTLPEIFHIMGNGVP
ncbi:Hypothetical protein CpOVID04_1823 [Corynebacterium pseudotuberculosis]|nr:Hypothetical protein CpPA07_0922 [Corynebacterium pseudotuberculosis]QBI73667.1 Hypothetical protein Cp38MAT_1817 [Corynebacterium pseudotuberculosis]QBK61185.1 Hypothetical protein CpE7_1823 [Corynebacterium pseudotuberculosis]QDL41605.1 Hypothetical protein CpOVID04_1823 [Corynebacterium pseudotuberculosis]QDL43713.1 Hypothetical protein CpOVIZ01_1826 [Corynebacterium pseudotuberculosis]